MARVRMFKNCYAVTSTEKWEKLIATTIDRFLPKLSEESIHFFINDNWFEKLHVKYFDAAFVHEKSKNGDWLIFIQQSRIKYFTASRIATVILHELKHCQQVIEGELSTEIVASYVDALPYSLPYDSLPWEASANEFADKHREEVLAIMNELEIVVGENNNVSS